MGEGPLVCAFRLDGRGGGVPISWEELDAAVAQPLSEQEFLWVHLHRKSPEAVAWLEARNDLDPVIVDALLAEETRPRCTDHQDGMLLNLRGVNLNPGADPDDMVSVRLWVTGNRIVSARNLKLLAVDDIRRTIVDGRGPTSVGMFIAALSDRLLDRLGEFVEDLDDAIDEIEELVIESNQTAMRGALANQRRQAIVIRRYIAPQRDAIARIMSLNLPFISQREHNRIREVYDGISRQVESLDEMRERAAIIQEEMATRFAEMMNNKLYVLSVAAAIFLPLNLLAGIMGMNVAGMPGIEDPAAFGIVVVALIATGILEFLFLKWMKWI